MDMDIEILCPVEIEIVDMDIEKLCPVDRKVNASVKECCFK